MSPTLDIDDFLTAEYEYIAATATQANEDRARVTTFYLISVGSFVGAALTTQVQGFNVQQLYIAFTVLFMLLSLGGVLTLMQLVRLRQAWVESARAMNQIKDFYVKNTQGINLQEAFRWQSTTIPAQYKPWSVSFMLALQVVLLGGVTLGATVAFFTLIFGPLQLAIAFGVGAGSILLQMLLYWLLLRK